MSIPNHTDYQAALTQAIQALGTAAFVRRLAELVATQIRCDCTLVLSYRSNGAAVYLYDNLQHRRDLLFQQYLNGVYADDPFYRALSQGLTDGVYSLGALVAQQGRGPDYMSSFYQATGWQDELGIVLSLHKGQWLTLFLGRLSAKPFTRSEQARLHSLLPLLSALCRQHWPLEHEAMALSPQPNSPVSVSPTLDGANKMRSQLEQALASFGLPRLTPREQQVAALLIQGQANHAIAEQLGIGVGTVKNHRKHLYSKLHIDSQSALFAHFLNHLITQEKA
ncbi:LuxR C-terminal-related transcriptional regulator [Oceanisphaera pacifica]|uniref:LuxR family transcriptional regulator n=1 Tax=Oceanisphaera pacifica TaxID=2818389 RepID=A0ABS3NDI0_9GAMM|nr:LuxR C-terminal-related transcriptional regulator [Oceanisphaera pacifica]MBO1518532.1 LuxR family transcriptional regulator [Oceanisphaera pacifica]